MPHCMCVCVCVCTLNVWLCVCLPEVSPMFNSRVFPLFRSSLIPCKYRNLPERVVNIYTLRSLHPDPRPATIRAQTIRASTVVKHHDIRFTSSSWTQIKPNTSYLRPSIIKTLFKLRRFTCILETKTPIYRPDIYTRCTHIYIDRERQRCVYMVYH